MPDNRPDDVASKFEMARLENEARRERMTSRRAELSVGKPQQDAVKQVPPEADVPEKFKQVPEEADRPKPEDKDEQLESRADVMLGQYTQEELNYMLSPFEFQADFQAFQMNVLTELEELRRRQDENIEDDIADPEPIYFGGYTDTFPWEKCSFGYKISGNQITVYTGSFIWGQKKFTATQQVFTISTSKAYIQLKLNWANAISDSGTIASIVNSGSTEQLPDDSDYYKTLYEVSLDGAGTAIDKSQTKIRHFLDFVIPGYMSPGV